MKWIRFTVDNASHGKKRGDYTSVETTLVVEQREYTPATEHSPPPAAWGSPQALAQVSGQPTERSILTSKEVK